MGHACDAAELLIRPEETDCDKTARALTQVNSERQKVELATFERACQMAESMGYDNPDRRTIVLAAEGWHQGVIGIVAARLVRKYCRPAIMIALDGAAGAARAAASKVFILPRRFRPAGSI